MLVARAMNGFRWEDTMYFDCIKIIQYDKQELLSLFSFKGLNKVFVDAIKMKEIRE